MPSGVGKVSGVTHPVALGVLHRHIVTGTVRRRAADRLVAAESRQAELDRAARDAERTAAETREARIRAEAALDQINQSLRV